MFNRLALTLLFCASSAGAQETPDEWVAFGSDSNKSVWMIRARDGLQGPGQHKAWIKIDYSKNQKETARQSLTLYRVDCSSQEIGTSQATIYYPDGRTKAFGPYLPVIMEAAVPESMGAAIVDMVCSNR